MLRRWPLLVLVLGLLVVLVSCAGRGGVSISVSPGEVTLAPGESVVFTAVVMGRAGTGVTWSASGGGLVPSGLTAVFTAPAEVGEYTVTAVSAQDSGRWATASVIVLAEEEGAGVNPPPYTGDEPVVGETGDDGSVVVVSESLGVQYDLTFRGEQGEPAAGVELVYRENSRGRSEFWLSDPSGLYAPLLMVGTPEELADQLGLTQSAVSSVEIGTSLDPITTFAGAVFLQALGVKLDKNGVAHQTVEYFVESGEDLCAEPDVYCTCATMAEVVELQSAAAYIDGIGGELVFSVVMFMGGLVNRVGEYIGLALDLMSAWGVGEGSAGVKKLLVEEARATAGLAGLDPDEPLLVRLLGFEAADAERSHSWRGVQVLNRGCGVPDLPDGGTLDVALVPNPPSPGREVQIDVQVGSPAEADLDVVLSVRNVGSGVKFSRVLMARTNGSGRASFVLPPFYSSIDAEYVVAVPERDLVFWESFEWDYLDTSVGRPRPTIWYLEPTRSRFDAPGGVNFVYQVSQVHEEPEYDKDLSCTLTFGDGSVPRSVPCLSLLGVSERIRSDQHRYESPGTYLARLTATNRDGSRDEVSVPIQVLGDSNRAPDVTSFTASASSVAVGGTVRFDWSVADHDRDDEVSCVFDAGDGSRRRVFDPCGSHEVSHQYVRQSPEWGYYATLSAVDRRGAYAPSRSASVVVGHEVVVGELTLTPGTIIGSAVEGGSAVGLFELENTGEVAVVVQSIASDAPWVSVSPSSVASIGVGDRVDVSVTLSAAGLAPGDYVTDVVVSWAPVGGGPTSTGQVGIEFAVSPGAVDPVVVSLAPTSVTLPANGNQSFTATVTGTADTSVSWAATCGSISGSGNTVTYTAPETAGSCTVVAISNADSSKSASATVTVTDGGADFEPAPSYISISNVSLGTASGGTRPVTFDISWDESWRGSSRPSWVTASDNWDAAWVFVKYRLSGGAWQHATLAGSGHVQPSGSVVSVPGDRMGAFIHRSSSGYGTFAANGVGLQWDYVADGVSAGASVEVQPFGIEMVFVPQGSFSLGSGGSSIGEFRAGGTTNTPFVVSGQSSIALGDSPGHLMWTESGYTGSPSGSTSASYPTGFEAYYVMKYEVTQGQYVDFLNTLTQVQADARMYTGSGYRYAITGGSVGSYATSLPFVAMNYISWADGAAFADWAGLRPMTELEFEKAARGPLSPVANEYAWGSTSITQATGLANAGTITETPTPEGANANYWVTTGTFIGPFRAGSFATAERSRRDAGAGYYGALELSGNLFERFVTVGNADGRAFGGEHGDGLLDVGGNATVVSWPDSMAVGAGFRGGALSNTVHVLRLSNRQSATESNYLRAFHHGWRGARSAP